MRRPNARRFPLVVGASLALTLAIVAPGPTLAAHGEACSTSGLQPRILVTDDLAYQETQYCLSGEWTTVSRMQLAPQWDVITETVVEPREQKYGLASAADFFDLKKYDPYAVIQVFRDAIESGAALSNDEKTILRLELAASRTQAELNREETQKEDRCEMRPRAYSEASIYFGTGWDPPENTGLPGQPTQIDFVFAPDVNERTKIAILNAIGQYELAVASQDAASRYPQRIVPHDPSDARQPTITFTGETPAPGTLAQADPGSGVRWPGERRQWVTGRILLGSETTPSLVGHEIGHVLGLDHLRNDHRVMRDGTYLATENGAAWNVDTDAHDRQSVAFDTCMFLPPENSIF